MMGARVVHMLFNRVQQLPVLGYEFESFADAGYELHLVCPSYGVDEELFRHRYPHVRLHPLRLRSREWSERQQPVLKLFRFLEFTWRARRTVDAIRPSLLVGHDMPAMLPLFRFMRFVPTVYNAHEIWSEASAANAPLRGAWRRLERKAVRNAHAMIVPEPNRARILHEEYGARELPVVAANIPPLRGPYRRSDVLRQRLGLAADDVIVLYQGLLAESRCLLELVGALRYLPSRMHLVLIGGGSPSYLRELRSMAERDEADARLHFLPWVDPEDLRELTASADIGVLPYRNSGRNNYFAAPNKLYEYLFAGLRVVSSSFPGLQDVIEGGKYGVCAAPDSSEDLARAIVAAAELPGGEVLAERARSQYCWDDEVQRIRSLYEKVLGGGK